MPYISNFTLQHLIFISRYSYSHVEKWDKALLTGICCFWASAPLSPADSLVWQFIFDAASLLCKCYLTCFQLRREVLGEVLGNFTVRTQFISFKCHLTALAGNHDMHVIASKGNWERWESSQEKSTVINGNMT